MSCDFHYVPPIALNGEKYSEHKIMNPAVLLLLLLDYYSINVGYLANYSYLKCAT